MPTRLVALTLATFSWVLMFCASMTVPAAAGQPGDRPRGPRPLDSSMPIGYFIAADRPGDGVRPGDGQLGEWALRAWQQASGRALTLQPAPEPSARVRLYWAGPLGGQYGEMRGLDVDGAVGAAVYVRPDTSALGPEIDALARRDPLFRDTVVYLTCLHELGHAFGLEHTAQFDDIMYSFIYGGDLVEYFSRYRRQLTSRLDIARVAGMSASDIASIRRLYPAAPAREPASGARAR